MAASHLGYRLKAVRAWLAIVAALVIGTLIVGGATRLTESGLSIVEWKPVTGVLPPLTEAQWQTEFEKYRQIPQYREINRGMSLSDFKTIFWWEWAHRFLGRTIGVVFLLPFVFFLWRGWIGPGLRGRLWGIFALGAVQGAVGWWMVSSGLVERTSVSQYRLAFHMTLACVIYAAVVWTMQRLTPGEPVDALPRHRLTANALIALVLLQIYLGALVAGLDAGLTFNTWPLIDGAFVPSAERLWFETPWWRNLFENALTAQFNHRMLAYLLLIVGVWHAIDITRNSADRKAKALAHAFAFFLVVQAGIGIATLLWQVPLHLALLHQAMALALLTIAVVQAVSFTPPRLAGTTTYPASA